MRNSRRFWVMTPQRASPRAHRASCQVTHARTATTTTVSTVSPGVRNRLWRSQPTTPRWAEGGGSRGTERGSTWTAMSALPDPDGPVVDVHDHRRHEADDEVD